VVSVKSVASLFLAAQQDPAIGATEATEVLRPATSGTGLYDLRVKVLPRCVPAVLPLPLL